MVLHLESSSIIFSKKSIIMGGGNIKIQYLIAYSVSITSVGMGVFFSWPAPVMPKFQNNETGLDISNSEMAWMVSMTSPGFMAGSLATRFLADRFGRRTTILLTAIPLLLGTAFVAFTLNAWLLYLARFLWGCGGGIFGTVVNLYVAEIADKEIRGSLTLVSRFMFNFGCLLIMCVGPFVSYRTLNYVLLGIPIAGFLSCYWIPESPYYLLKEGKSIEAKKVMTRIRLYEDEKMLKDDLIQMQSHVKNEMRHSSSFKELFTSRRYRKAVVIAGVLKLTQILTGQLILQHYLGLIMLESGTHIKLTLIFIIFGILRFFSSVMSSMLADKLGRRPLLIYSYLGTAISLGIIGFYFFLLQVVELDREVIRPYSFVPFAGIICCNIISTLGYYSVIVLIPAEIFALNIKAVALTSISILGGFLNFCIAIGYQTLKDYAGLTGVFWFMATAAVAGCIFSILYVPETRGKSLRDIQILLQGDMFEYDTEVVVKLNAVVDTDIIVKNEDDIELLDVTKKFVNGDLA